MSSRTTCTLVLLAALSCTSCSELHRTRVFATIGVARAQYELGLAYTEGDAVEPDLEEAARWFQKSADQGNADAQFRLARMYAEGVGVEHDYAKAYGLLNLAALQGNAEAEPLRRWVAQELAREQRQLSPGAPAPRTAL